jgi:hypothetical protein
MVYLKALEKYGKIKRIEYIEQGIKEIQIKKKR